VIEEKVKKVNSDVRITALNNLALSFALVSSRKIRTDTMMPITPNTEKKRCMFSLVFEDIFIY